MASNAISVAQPALTGSHADAWTRILNPLSIGRHLIAHRSLLWQLARRNLQTQFLGSWLGMLWAILTPLLLLAVYTFVFSVVFRSRWGTDEGGSQLDYALNLFVSLTTFNIFAKSFAAAPSLIPANQNYVKKVVFPLELLPVAQFVSSLIESGLALAVFFVALVVVRGGLPVTAMLLPIVLLPLALWTLGCSLVLSALGVFVRDMQNVIGISVTVLMFTSAVFFPLASVPDAGRKIMTFNPLVTILEDVRRVCLQGTQPHWPAWGVTMVLGAVFAVAGWAWFMKFKPAFADVL